MRKYMRNAFNQWFRERNHKNLQQNLFVLMKPIQYKLTVIKTLLIFYENWKIWTGFHYQKILFKSSEKTWKKVRLFWQNEKAPYVIDNVIRKTCYLGPQKAYRTKIRNKIELFDYKNGHPRGKSKRFVQQRNRKVNCSTVMKITNKYCIRKYYKHSQAKAKVRISIVNSVHIIF